MHKNRNLFKTVTAVTGMVGLGVVGKTVYDYKREDTEQSFQSWLLERIFQIFSYPLTHIESEKLYKKGIKTIGRQIKDPIKIPKLNNIQSSEINIEGMQTLLFNDKKEKKQPVVFFLHGGAYLIQPALPHFKTAEDLIKQTDAKVVMPIYPKAPHYTFKEAYPKVLNAYLKTLHQIDSPSHLTLMGDSAGGGLALGLSSLLAQKRLPQPKQLILISPWLDASSENPEIKEYEQIDTVLPAQPYFQATGRLWAGGEKHIYHPLVSPLYTDQLGSLPPIHIFAGSDEMLYPDVLRFQSFMEESGRPIQLHIKENMVHDYVIFNTPEGQEARNKISELILNA